MKRRRRRRLLRWTPWLLAGLVITSVALLVRQASLVTADELVAQADAVRRGDPESDVPRDPRGSLAILRGVLERHPQHYDALLTSAQSYADLGNHEVAVAQLDRAAEVAAAEENMGGTVRALKLAVNYHTAAGRYDAAEAKAREIVDLAPNNLAHRLNLGLAQYNGSTATQADLLRRFVQADKTDIDLEIEARVEAFVTDLWGTPDPDALVEWLAPEVDTSVRLAIRAELMDARRRFLAASETLSEYPYFDGFDQRVSEAWCELLLRSGRLFEAHLEANMALRHPRLQDPARRWFLDILADCETAVGEHALAADRHEVTSREFYEKRGFAPSRYLDGMLEARVAAEQWDLLLKRLPEYRKWSRETELLDWAHAEALAATGERDAARAAIRKPANVVSLGTQLPLSLRAYPERRRRILMLAHELYAEVRDSRALQMLDALLAEQPGNLEARRLRIEQFLADGLLDAARDDAFALLTRERRDAEDFALWLDICNRLSEAHYGADLHQRATQIVAKDIDTRVAFVEALFARSQVGGGGRDALEAPTDLAGLRRHPDLAYAVIQARLAADDLVQARIEARQLAEANPQVQAFRFLLARLLVREGKFDAAATEFRLLLDAVPTDSEAIELAMRVELARGRHQAAAELVNEMILADPRGVGAVRYGLRLLDRGDADRAAKLVERLFTASDGRPGLDVWLLAARAYLAQGDLEAATNVLVPLATSHGDSDEVALLGLQLGLATDTQALVEGAAERLAVLAGGLFPNQLERLTSMLLAAGRHELLLSLFDEGTRDQPSVEVALRPLAEAAKALGRVDEAAALLERADDDASVRDRFLLLALDGRGDEANRRLRLETHRAARRAELELCSMVGAALNGQRALVDPVPAKKLRELGVHEELGARRTELLDALLRLLPVIDHLDDALPQQVLTKPLAAYPTAGPDVAAWIDLARDDPDAARQSARSLLLLLLAGDRPFWERESQYLARAALERLPGSVTASSILARRAIDAGEPLQALVVLERLLERRPDDVEFLGLALRAARDAGRDAWGLALLAEQQQDPGVRLLLAEALAERGHSAAARALLDELARELPGSPPEVLQASLELAALDRRQSDAASLVRVILARHPDHAELRQACLDTMASFALLREDGRAVAEELAAAHPEHLGLQVAVAQAAQDDPARVATLLDELVRRVEQQPLSPEAPGAEERALLLRRAALAAHRAGLAAQTRRLYELSLLVDPGAVEHYRDLAYLELEDGNLLAARRYLEVLAFVNPTDKEALLTLARLLFEQVGRPHEAADLIADAYRYSMPPAAVEVLAADAYLRGEHETALALFHRVANSPLVTEDTYLLVGRIAYASGLDDAASKVFHLFLQRAPQDHPARARVEVQRGFCTPEPADEVAAG